ncbi:MAG: hypothetical protein ABS96_20940 [Lysobacteraceae bacterium SCN 69-123]|nr:MAG: hypothetical protein ABS96_20940 [Xanthomonadaceae bacterium SCN 69-123]OJY72634.1 MAG: hypothetical protein BGP18_07495 [Stenotrophomonas sp. 69-14]
MGTLNARRRQTAGVFRRRSMAWLIPTGVDAASPCALAHALAGGCSWPPADMPIPRIWLAGDGCTGLPLERITSGRHPLSAVLAAIGRDRC